MTSLRDFASDRATSSTSAGTGLQIFTQSTNPREWKPITTDRKTAPPKKIGTTEISFTKPKTTTPIKFPTTQDLSQSASISMPVKIKKDQEKLTQPYALQSVQKEPVNLYSSQKKLTQSQLQSIQRPQDNKKTSTFKPSAIKFAKATGASLVKQIADSSSNIANFIARNVISKKISQFEPILRGDVKGTLKTAFELTEGNINRNVPGLQIGIDYIRSGGASKIAERSPLAKKWLDFYTDQRKKGSIPTEQFKRIATKLESKNAIVPTKEWTDASITDKIFKKTGETIYNIGPSIISSWGIFAINPPAGAIVSVTSTAEQVKDVAMQYTDDEDKAEKVGLVAGIAVGALDRIVPSKLFGNKEQKKLFIKEFIKEIITNSLEEGSTEVTQELIQIAAEKVFRDDLGWDEVKTRTALAGMGGIIGGGSMTTIGNMTNVTIKQDILGEEKIVIDDGEYTPQQVIGNVIKTGTENTPEGKELIKSATEAQKRGENIVVKNEAPKVETPTNSTIEKVSKDDQKRIDQYNKEYKDQLLNTDNVRELFTPEGYNRINSAEYHESASALSDKIFNQQIKKLEPGDNYLFMAGSSGSGKSTALKQYPDITKDVRAGFDGNFSSKSSLQKLDKVIDTGAKPIIVFVYRDPIDSWVNGVVRRAINPKNRRVVPLNIFIKNLNDSPSTVLKAHEKYGDRVDIQVLDNSRGKGNVEHVSNPIEFLKKIDYNISDVEQKATNYVKNKTREGIISKETSEALLRSDTRKEISQEPQQKYKEQRQSPVKTTLKSPITSIIEEQIKTSKNIKDVKNTLKNIRKELKTAIDIASGVSEVAIEQRAGVTTKRVALLKAAYAKNVKFQEGDIETMRSSKYGNLVNNVVENIQEAHPELNLSDDEAFEYALQLPTKQDEAKITPDIRILDKKEKALRKYLDILKTKQEELNISKDNELNKEWDAVMAEQEQLYKLIEVPREQLPVGEGKQRASKLEARMKGVLGNATLEQIKDLGLSTSNIAENDKQLSDAAKYITENPKEAMDVLEGKIEPPKGLLKNSIFVAMTKMDNIDMNLATKLTGLGSTRYGQEIQILSQIDPNSTISILSNMQKMLEIKIVEKFKTKDAKEGIKKRSDRIIERKNKTEKKLLSQTNWDAFINSIDTC